MKVTVGRIVHYFPSTIDTMYKNNGADFHAAIVTHVWNDGMVNLMVFPASGDAVIRSSVSFNPSDTSSLIDNYCKFPERA